MNNEIIILLLGIVTIIITRTVYILGSSIKTKRKNELVTKYVDLLSEMINDAVIATNQTYVDSLKAKDSFIDDAQKVAFEKTFSAVKDELSDDMIKVLSEVTIDLDTYLTNQIEATVKAVK